MRLAGDVRGYFHAVREADAGNLTDSGVRLARSLRRHFSTHTALERRSVERRAILERVEAARKRGLARLRRFVLTPLLRELIDGGHYLKTRARGIQALYRKVRENATKSSLATRQWVLDTGPPRTKRRKIEARSLSLP